MDYKEMFPDYKTIKPGEWSNHNQTITCIGGNGEKFRFSFLGSLRI